jgi:thiosulfate/3-mercaptopyruvate sulfurtransferase
MKKLTAHAEWIKTNLKNDNVKIIDARYGEFLRRIERRGPACAGRIVGARNIPFNTVTDDKLKLKDDVTLRKMFTDAGVKAGDTVITYCHIGQQGTADYFVAKKLGYKVALYDGSFQEWRRLKDTPVENPRGDRAPTTVSLVTPQWLEEHAGDPNVRVLDVRSECI